MIKIQVVACNDVPLSQVLFAEFDELGGNIGRADDNVLVLEDPKRYISRIHATITFRNGQYFIRSLGSAIPVYLNGRSLSHGQDESITEHDEICIGDYMMQVICEQAFESISETNSASTVQKDEPGALFFDHTDGDSFDNLGASSISDSSISAAHIPSDFDPSAQLSSSGVLEQVLQSKTPIQDNLSSELVSTDPEKNIDSFINPGNPLDNLSDQVDVNSVDPLVVMSNMSEKKIVDNYPQHDHVPELQSSFQPPKIKEDIVDTPMEACDNSEIPIDDAGVVGSVANKEELLHAFLVGAGVPDLDMPTELTPQMMNLIGQLLRVSTQGTLDLLLARSAIKSEMHAEMTLIAPRKNNPLKYSPNVEAALAHLLAPKARGFMSPLEAMSDAHDDLCSHQFGFMAGMRSALTGVLERFNPQILEQQLTQKTVIDSLVPMNRKAKLWTQFVEHYSNISQDAEEDFHALFGKEFLRAYEAQISKLEQDDK